MDGQTSETFGSDRFLFAHAFAQWARGGQHAFEQGFATVKEVGSRQTYFMRCWWRIVKLGLNLSFLSESSIWIFEFATTITSCKPTCSHLLVPSLESPPKGIVSIPRLSEDSPRFFLRGFLSALLEPKSEDAKTNRNHQHENKPSEHSHVHPPFLLLKPSGNVSSSCPRLSVTWRKSRWLSRRLSQATC
jgi:hypothetical protein